MGGWRRCSELAGRHAQIVNDDLWFTLPIPRVYPKVADNIDGLREVRQEGAEAEADGAEMPDGSGEVFASASDEARTRKGDVLQEKAWLVISLTARFKFLEVFAEVERESGRREDSIDRQYGNEIFS